MKQPLFPSAEIMDDATALVLPVNPGGDILEIIDGRIAITDNIEVGLWCGRVMDGRRVNGTFAGVMDNPVLVPEIMKGQMS